MKRTTKNYIVIGLGALLLGIGVKVAVLELLTLKHTVTSQTAEERHSACKLNRQYYDAQMRCAADAACPMTQAMLDFIKTYPMECAGTM